MLKFLGGRIREIRKSHGMTQEDLGDKAGLNPNYVGYVERGEKNMTVKNILVISRALGVPMAELFSSWKSDAPCRESVGTGKAVKEYPEGADRFVPMLGKEEAMKAMKKILVRMSLERLNAFYRIAKLIEQ